MTADLQDTLFSLEEKRPTAALPRASGCTVWSC